MKALFLTAILFSAAKIYSQQLPQYSQYLRNQIMMNPGATGLYDFTDLTLSGRSQWIGLQDAPKTSYVSIASPIGREKIRYNPGIRISSGTVKNPKINTGQMKHALGGQLIADQYGAFRRLSTGLLYACHLPLNKKYNLAFGTKLGISHHSFLQEKAIVLNMSSDHTYQDYISGQLNRSILDLGVGFYLYSDKLFFGIAGDNLSGDRIQTGNTNLQFDPTIHWNITGGIKLKASENLTFTPAFLVKYMQPAPISIEGSIQLEYKEWIWTGITYRNKDAIIGMCGLNITNKFKFGYSYDFSLSRFNDYSGGSHEIILGLMIGR